MAVLEKGTKFPAKVAAEVFSKVKGKSSLAKLSPQIPVSFNGTDIFTFALDSEIAIVAEGAKKPHGGVSADPVRVQPIKVVYQARVSDEFLTASEEAKVDILSGFTDGFSKKLASGLDKMAFHGINPATGTKSELITSYFDGKVTNKVTYAEAAGGDKSVQEAITLLGENDATGIAISKTFATMLADETYENGQAKFPELAWGGQPERLRGLNCDVNSTVGTADYAIVGDFSAFKWGYAKDVRFEVIEYGDPDGTGVDLKSVNQVMLRAEAYIGFAVLDPAAFARVTAS